MNGEDLNEDEQRKRFEKAMGGFHAATAAPPQLADLIDKIEQAVIGHVLLPARELATLIAIWIAGTYSFRLFRYVGYLALRSATPRCGKTRLLRLIAAFSDGNPPVTSIPTAATIFRSGRSVLLLDEVDKLAIAIGTLTARSLRS